MVSESFLVISYSSSVDTGRLNLIVGATCNAQVAPDAPI